MFHREIASELQDLIKYYPVVTLIGPRQSVKTTLGRSLFLEKPFKEGYPPGIDLKR